jgi:tetratricopeptide (TPR) repeat protein
MAEIIGLVATGAQLFEQTSKIISLVGTLSSELRDELGTIARQLSHANLLLDLAQRIQNDSPPSVEQHVKSCLEDLNIIHSKLAEINAGSRKGLVNKLRMTMKFKAKERDISLAWKRIEGKMRGLCLALEWENCLAVGDISKHLISHAPAIHDTRIARIPIHHSSGITVMLPDTTEVIDVRNPTQPPVSMTFSRVYNMERNKSHCFVGRDELLTKLTFKLGALGTQNRVALYGLGGIGHVLPFFCLVIRTLRLIHQVFRKSSLAFQYATETNKALPGTWVFWIRADTKLQFLQDYLGVASYLNLNGTEDSPVSTQDVSRCLHDSHFGDWIMIVDNVDDDAIMDREESLVDLIPTNSKGSVIFTTRSRRVAASLVPADNIIRVDDPDSNEARDLFCQEAGLTHSELCETEQTSVSGLLQSLNHLPLAICHAGAFISGQQIAVSEYFEMLNAGEDAKALLLDDESFPQGPVRAKPVLLTLSISLDRLVKVDTLAGDLLSFIACVSPRKIPKSLLPSAVDHAGISVSFLTALGLLRSHCLITADSDNQTFYMHSVVHLAARRWLRSRSQFHHWIQKAMKAVLGCFPTAPSLESGNLSSCAQFLPHAHAVLEYKDFPPELDLPRCLLAHRCSQYLQITGRYSHAEWFSRLSADLSGMVFGIDNPDHLTKQEDHGTVLYRNGKFAAAIRLQRAVLENQQRLLGEHKDTLSSLNNLGLSLQGQGQYAEAEHLHRRALGGRQKKLGEDDPHTLASLNNLSLVLEKQERYHEAEMYARKAVSVKRRIYGRENLATLLSISALAICLQKQGKFSEAEKLHREVLRSRERQLGMRHPLTLNAKIGLISTLADEGQFERTEKLARDHLAFITEALGPQHLQSLLMAHNLAFILLRLGKNEEAERLARESFLSRKRVLGAKHTDTKASEELLDDILDAIKENMATAEKETQASFILTPPGASKVIVKEENLDEVNTIVSLDESPHDLNETNSKLSEEMFPAVPGNVEFDSTTSIKPEIFLTCSSVKAMGE